MQKFVLLALVIGVAVLVVGPVAAQQPQPANPPAPAAQPVAPTVAPVPAQNAQQFVLNLVGQVGNKDPRIRFAVREGLVAMGSQATPVLLAAKANHTDAHVLAFIDRTVKRLKSTTKKRGGRNIFFMGNRGRDIDRIAMELNLSWEQMAKLEPVFKKYDKDSKELMAAMREEGGFSDREGWKDLAEEMKLMREEAEPKLSEFLDEKQTKGAMRYLGRGGGTPFAFDGGTGSIQILGGPGGAASVVIKKTTVGGDEGK